jgi:hypothetical protein
LDCGFHVPEVAEQVLGSLYTTYLGCEISSDFAIRLKTPNSYRVIFGFSTDDKVESTPKPRKLLEQAGDAIRLKHDFLRTEQTYVWVKRYNCPHKKQRQTTWGLPKSKPFLSIWPLTVVSPPARLSRACRHEIAP